MTPQVHDLFGNETADLKSYSWGCGPSRVRQQSHSQVVNPKTPRPWWSWAAGTLGSPPDLPDCSVIKFITLSLFFFTLLLSSTASVMVFFDLSPDIHKKLKVPGWHTCAPYGMVALTDTGENFMGKRRKRSSFIRMRMTPQNDGQSHAPFANWVQPLGITTIWLRQGSIN